MTHSPIPNAIVVKVENILQMFLVDDDGDMLDMPSIPISDDEHIYDSLKESQIQFIHVIFEKLNEDDEIDLSNYDDYTKLGYRIKDLFITSIGKGEVKDHIEEISIKTVMKEDVLAELVKEIFVDKLDSLDN